MKAATLQFGAMHAKAGRQSNGPGGESPSQTPLGDDSLMEQIASDAVLEQAYDWLCRQRHDASPHDDVWIVRERWAEIKRRLQEPLLSGSYQFTVVGLQLVAQTKQRFVERVTRLQEQGATVCRIAQYVRPWLTWVRSGGPELRGYFRR